MANILVRHRNEQECSLYHTRQIGFSINYKNLCNAFSCSFVLTLIFTKPIHKHTIYFNSIFIFMKKAILFLYTFLFCLTFVLGQNKQDFIQNYTQKADVIFEGIIVQRDPLERKDSNLIFTKNTILVTKIWKGELASETLELISEGGQTATRMTQTAESRFLYQDFAGVFFAKQTPNGLQILNGGVLHYDKLNRRAASMNADVFENLETDLYAKITENTGKKYHEVAKSDFFLETKSKGNARTEAIEINSFVPTEVTGGTLMKLTINGSGFGTERGVEGNVFFTNNSDGGATMRQLVERGFWRQDYDAELISWSDTKIEVYVPSFAGTGKIAVVNDEGERFDSFAPLQVKYAVSTVRDFGFGIGIPGAEPEKLKPAQNPILGNQNSNGGYTIFVDPKVFTDEKMMGAITRALGKWRCATGINFSIASNQADVGLGYTGKSIIAMPNADFGGGIGIPQGFAFSNYEICNTGTKRVWHVREFQIYISPSTAWVYDETPTARNMDFESMILLLLGRAAQVEYVNTASDLMFFRLQPGATKRNPSPTNIEAAKFVLAKSFNADPDCGPKGMKAVEAAACNQIVEAPLARFEAEKTEFCEAPAKVQFKDDSRNPSSYAWTFAGGTPATSTEKNPVVSYEKAGTYNVSLTVKNPNTSHTTTKNAYIKIGGTPVKVDLGADRVVCQGERVVLDTKIEGATYEWSNGASTQSIEVRQAGTYSVKVTKSGCESKGEVKVSFSEPVSAGQSRAICLGESVQLQATGGTSYVWSPRIGLSNPNIANPTATPTATTFYTVTAKTVGCGEVTSIVRVTVDTKPVLMGLPVDKEIVLCDNNATAFFNVFAQGTGIEYLWSNGNNTGFLATREAGKYWVKVTNSTGCFATDTLTVKKVTKITADAGRDTTTCAGNPIQLMAKGGDLYVWSPTTGLDNPFVQNPIARLTETITYSVRVRGTGACEPVTDEVKITVVPRPVLNLPRTLEVCENTVVLDTKIENADFQWSNGSRESKITVSKSGTYFVTVRPRFCPQVLNAFVSVSFPSEGIKLDLGKDTLTCLPEWVIDAQKDVVWNTGEKSQKITVKASGIYSAEFTDKCGKIYRDTIKVNFDRLTRPFANRKINVCNEQVLRLDAQNAGKTFRWNTGANTSQTTVSQNGTYFVTITDNCRNEVRDTVTVFFEKAFLELPATVFACERQMSLDAQVPNAEYEWSNGAKTQRTTVSEDGRYSVKLKTNCGKNLEGSTQVFFFEKSTADFDFKIEGDGKVIFTNKSQSTHSLRYEWTFAENAKSTDMNPTFTFQKIGNYKVKLTITSTNCQASKTVEKDVQIIVSSNQDNEMARKIMTYPNPVKDHLTIKWNGMNQAKKIRVLDLIGKKWLEQSINTPETETILNLANLAKGLYFLEIQTEGKKLVRKMLVE